jgi:carboxyl-terminal processing protease
LIVISQGQTRICPLYKHSLSCLGCEGGGTETANMLQNNNLTRKPYRTLGGCALLGLSLLCLIGIQSSFSKPQQASAPAALSSSPKALVDQAWQIVNQRYVDATFNRQDWQMVRQKFLQKQYTNKTEAYQNIRAMLASLNDQYTRFLTPEELKALADNITGEFVGVGLTVSLEAGSREWVVENIFAESPAATAGVQKQDIVVSLNGKPTPQIDPATAAPYLIGPVGSKLIVQVRRGKQNLSYTLVRENINLNPLTFQIQQTQAGKVGYIKLPIFSTKTAQSMDKAIQSLEKQGVVGYILDMRGNPGGVLDAGLEVAQDWISRGVLVSIKDRSHPQLPIQAKRPALTNRPLVALVDQESASASEVVAAALQDQKRAMLVGTKTLGKGLIQEFLPLTDGSGVLVTIAKYFTPKGRDIDKLGIIPNIVVEQSSTPQQPGNKIPGTGDRQYQQALKSLLVQVKRPKGTPKT